MLKQPEKLHYSIYESNQINLAVKAHYCDIVTMSEMSRKIDREKEREAL